MSNSCVIYELFVSGVLLLSSCIFAFLRVKVTVLLRKCQRERHPPSRDLTAVKSLLTQTNLHHVGHILIPYMHSCSQGIVLH